MLYKFKSKAGADVIMLEATGLQALQIMGKTPDSQGILLPEQMTQALAALKAAIEDDAAQAKPDSASAHPKEELGQRHINLRTRMWPLMTLIEHSQQANTPITWGV